LALQGLCPGQWLGALVWLLRPGRRDDDV